MPQSAHLNILRRAVAGVALIASTALASTALPLPVSARESQAIATPFEVGESPAGNYLAALVAGAERDTTAASTYFQEALRFDPRNAQLIERAFVAALSNGSMPDAFRLAERLLAREPTNSLAQLTLGVKALKNKQYSSARSFFAKSTSTRERDITATLLTAWSYAGAGDGKRALDIIDKLPGDNFSVFRDYHAGLIADVVNNAPEAAKRMKAAYNAEKTTLRLVDAYGRFMSHHGDQTEAQRAYQAFDDLLPRHPVITAALADLKSGKSLDPLVRNAEGGAAEVLYGLGSAGSRETDKLPAMIYLRLALYLTPGNALAIISLADMYDSQKQHERAIDAYELVADTSPLRANADIQTALTLEILGRTDAALKQLTAIVEKHPNDAEALNALGNLQRSRKQYAEAATSYSRLIETIKTPGKGDWPNFYNRGIAYERSKQWPLAEADFKKALELSPDQPLILNYLGYSWIDQGINLDEGFRMLRRAVDQKPDDGYVIDSLGWAFYKLGRYDEAVTELERAIDKKSSDPVINDHLGDAYYRVGRKLEAGFQWNHARDLKPEPDDLAVILKKIATGTLETTKTETAPMETTPVDGRTMPLKTGG